MFPIHHKFFTFAPSRATEASQLSCSQHKFHGGPVSDDGRHLDNKTNLKRQLFSDRDSDPTDPARGGKIANKEFVICLRLPTVGY